MINSKFKSIDTILERVLRSPLMNGVSKADVASDVAECILLIGAPLSFDEKIEAVTVTDYRAQLPCDLMQIIQTRRVTDEDRVIPMRYASDTFNSSYHTLGSPDYQSNSDSTYSLNGGYMYTSFESGTVQIAYSAVKTDDEGVPMIPDEPKYELAIEYHIKWRWYSILWEQQKISDKVFQHVEQQRDWYIGAAGTQALMLNIDQAETFRASFSRMIYDENQAKTQFVNSGVRENFNVNGQARLGNVNTETNYAVSDISLDLNNDD